MLPHYQRLGGNRKGLVLSFHHETQRTNSQHFKLCQLICESNSKVTNYTESSLTVTGMLIPTHKSPPDTRALINKKQTLSVPCGLNTLPPHKGACPATLKAS